MKEGNVTKRLGVVKLDMKYVVDLDDEEMVQDAMDALFEDMLEQIKKGTLIDVIISEEDHSVTWGDVAYFLKEEVGDVLVLDSEEE